MFTINEFQIESDLSKAFEYYECEDDSFELFFKDSDDMFLTWDFELIPEDVSYISDHETSPILKNEFPLISVYDEKSLNNMMFALKSITSVPKNKNMNYFMNRYFLFQINISSFSVGLEKKLMFKLREEMFKYFMYTHPMNEVDRFSFGLIGGEIVFNNNLKLKDYLISYYNFYICNYDEFRDRMNISKAQIKDAKELSLLILGLFEAGEKIQFNETGNVALNNYINNIDLFLSDYRDSKKIIFDFICVLSKNNLSGSEKLGLDYLLQNYVCYILYINPCEIEALFNYFESELTVLGKIFNSIYLNSIFFKNRVFKRINNKKIKDKIINLLNSENKKIYGYD